MSSHHKTTNVSLTGDEIIGDNLRDNTAFIPVAVSPHSHTSGLFNLLMYGTDPPLPPPKFDDGRINAMGAYRLACSQRVPHGILKRADDWWRINHPGTPFSDIVHLLLVFGSSNNLVLLL